MNIHFGQAYLVQQSKAKPGFLNKWLGLPTETKETARRFDEYIAANHPDGISHEIDFNERLVLDADSAAEYRKEVSELVAASGLQHYEDDALTFGVAYAGIAEREMVRYLASAKKIDLDA